MDTSSMSYRELIALRHSINERISSIEENALNQLMMGEQVEDFVLTTGASRRVIADEPALVGALREYGVTNKELYTAKIIGVPAIEKLCKEKMLSYTDIAKPFIEEKQGATKIKYVGKA